jgi:hypothetical protein
MAQLFLKDETHTVGANSTAESFGSAGTETLVVAAGAIVKADQNIERIELSGASSAYTYSVAGNVVTVKLGTVAVATYTVANGDKTIAFADGSAVLAFTKLDAVTLGGKAISSTTSSALTGITLNKTDVSASAVGSTTIPVTPAYVIASSATSVTEGNAVTFTVTPAVVSVTAQTLNYLISGAATTSSSVSAASTTDFSVLLGTVTLAANATSATFTVTPVNDGVVEGIEGFKVYLLDSNFDKVATSSSSILINDSVPTITLTGATTVNEGSAITYTATLSSAVASAVTIPYTLSGTGITTADFTGQAALTGNISVAAGATSGTLTLNVAADTTTEGVENLSVALAAPTSGATLGSSSSVVTSIADTSLTVLTTPLALQIGSTSVAATTGKDMLTFDVAAAKASPLTTQIKVTSFAPASDILQIDLPTVNAAITTLAQLNGQQGVTALANGITGQTDISFGNNAAGNVITISLIGLTDLAAVSVTVI